MHIRRRFQFSSALKRMSTISTLPNGKALVSVKGAPETIRGMLTTIPVFYDKVYKQYTKQGSRVLALGCKEVDGLTVDKVGVQALFVTCDVNILCHRLTSFRETRSSRTLSSPASWCSIVL